MELGEKEMNRILLLIIFGVCTILGVFLSVSNIRGIRALRKYTDALFAWAEPPLLAFKYERFSWFATSIHWLAVITLGLVDLFILLMLRSTELNIPGVPESISTFLEMPVLVGCTAGIAVLWGQSLFSPIAARIGGDRHFAINAEGILYAGHLFPWGAFSHFSFDEEHKVVQIWSASLPGTVGLTISPPSEAGRSEIVGLIQSHIPLAEAPPRRSMLLFPLIMASFVAPFVVLAALTFLLSAGLALLLNGLLIYSLALYGGKLIMRLVYGGKAKPVAIK